MTYKEITPLQKEKIISFYKKSKGNLKLTSNQFDFISKWSIRNLLQEEKIYGTFKKEETAKEKSRRKSINVINWKKQKKIMLIEYKGGKCEICGYNKCLEALESLKEKYKDDLLVFSKTDMLNYCDPGDNTGDLRTTMYAVNIIPKLAKDKGIKYFFSCFLLKKNAY
jgi:hypothetical protein